MKSEQIDKMIAAARGIVSAAEGGHPIDELTIEWARAIIAANATRGYRKRETPAADRLLAVWQATPLAGYTLGELRKLVGNTVNASFQHLLRAQVIRRLIFSSGPHSRKRYFTNEDACNEAAISCRQQADAARIKALTPKPLKIPRLAAPKKPKVAGAPREKKASLPPKPITLRQRGPAMRDSGQAFTPPHVQIQRIPTPVDTRYHVEAPTEGFLADWRKLRGEA